MKSLAEKVAAMQAEAAAKPEPLLPGGTRARLDTPARVTSQMGKVYRLMAEGRLDPNAGGKMIRALSLIGRQLELTGLAKKVAAIEKAIGSRR